MLHAAHRCCVLALQLVSVSSMEELSGETRMYRTSATRSSTDKVIQLTLTFPCGAGDKGGRRIRREQQAVEAATLLADTLTRLCRVGHCAIPERQLLAHTQVQTRLDRRLLTCGLGRAIRSGHIAREAVNGEVWILPAALRSAEITIARCARQLAEGPHLIERGQAKLERFALLCSSNACRAIDAIRRLTIKVHALGYATTLIAPDRDAANWYRTKLLQPVFEIHTWCSGSPARSKTEQEGVAVLLDSSRLGVEDMASLLEGLPPRQAVVMFGDPNETPRHGHGQPFRDLAVCELFQTLIISANRPTSEQMELGTQARRSALVWRLRRGAGLPA